MIVIYRGGPLDGQRVVLEPGCVVPVRVNHPEGGGYENSVPRADDDIDDIVMSFVSEEDERTRKFAYYFSGGPLDLKIDRLYTSGLSQVGCLPDGMYDKVPPGDAIPGHVIVMRFTPVPVTEASVVQLLSKLFDRVRRDLPLTVGVLQRALVEVGIGDEVVQRVVARLKVPAA